MVFAILNLLLLYVGLGYLSAIRKITGTRAIHNQHSVFSQTQLFAGNILKISVQFQLPKWLPTPYLVVQERLVRHDGKSQRFEGMLVSGLNKQATFNYEIPKLTRGEYTFSETLITRYDIFGLKAYHEKLLLEQKLQVMPQLLSTKQWSLLANAHQGRYSSPMPLKHAKESSQQSGVREYVHGDRLSKVHWNATARTGNWKSKDFEREAMQKGIIVLDCYREKKPGSTHEQDEQYEYMVSITASLLDYSAKLHSPIGLLSIEEQHSFYAPTTMVEQISLMMNHLITVKQAAPTPLSYQLQNYQKELQASNMLHIVTQELSSNMLAAIKSLQGKGVHTTLFIPAYSYSAAGQANLRQSIAMFRMQGISVIECYEQTYERTEGSGTG